MSRFSLSDPGRRQRCWTTGYVHEQENRKTIDQVYAAFGEGDIEGVLGMLTNDVQWTSPGPPDVITYASSRTGDEQVAGYFESCCEAVKTTTFRPQRFFAQDDLVVVLGRYTLRVVKSGTVIYNDWVRAFERADDKISALEGKLAVGLR
jgi:ketosteroid isomerase-like protein